MRRHRAGGLRLLFRNIRFVSLPRKGAPYRAAADVGNVVE
jgi:hypothetical protein